jgi:hypothetical protein
MRRTSTRRRHLSPLLAIGVISIIGTVACVSGAPAVGAGTSAPGQIAAVTQTPPSQVAGQTQPAPTQSADAGSPPEQGGPAYTIEQALSDRAQLNTIAFDALGFLTGTLGSDSFFPPGKVADFWGFQYLRDNDPSEMGHNTDFLTSASLNMLSVLSAEQRGRLIALATSQVDSINEYGYKRFVLMKGFRRLLEGDLPPGTSGLNEQAVKAYSAELYALDGRISFERAQVMGPIVAALTSDQRADLDAMVGKGMSSWPKVQEPSDLQGLSRDEKVAVMTYAGDMFSWYAGSVEADIYFCPERHGTYFGSFYLKDAPAVGNPGYSIDTTITGNLGAALIERLTDTQAQLITSLVDTQRPSLDQIVDARRAVSTELRKFMAGQSADSATVSGLMKTYGELDGTIVYNLATNFVEVGQSLTADERAALIGLRTQLLGDLATPTGAYLFSQPIGMPDIPNTDFLFQSTGTPPTGTALPVTLRIAGGYKSSLTTAYGTAAGVRSGTYVTLGVAVSPAAANIPVRFYQRVGRTRPWTYLSTGRTDTSGVVAWSKVVRVPAGAVGYGRYVYFRVALPGPSEGSTAWSNAVRAVAT